MTWTLHCKLLLFSFFFFFAWLVCGGAQSNRGPPMEKQPCIFTLRTCQTCTFSSCAAMFFFPSLPPKAKYEQYQAHICFYGSLGSHIHILRHYLAQQTETDRERVKRRVGVVLTTLARSAQLCSIICCCNVAWDSTGMIHKDIGLVSSEAWSHRLIAAAPPSFSCFFLSSSLWPTVLGLSCSPSNWNVSPTRCWEELLGPYRLVFPLLSLP